MHIRTIRNTILTATLSFALMFTGATVANAAPPAPAGPTITLDGNGTGLPLSEAAADWSKGTGITVVEGDCTGPLCVTFHITSAPCGQVDYFNSIGGCAFRTDDGGCHVDIDDSFLDRYWTVVSVVKHEAGHCILNFGGLGMIHLSDSSLMGPNGDRNLVRKSQTRLTHEDRSTAAEAFADGIWG